MMKIVKDNFINFEEIETQEPVPGFKVKFVHTANMTLAYWNSEAGALLPEHSHIHEQVTNIIEGEFELVIEGETRVLNAGDTAVIPANLIHSGKSITKCRIIDIFYPIREDYIFN